jgi:CHAT domain-containing protein
MLLSLSLAVLLTIQPAAGLEAVAREFVDALVRDDLDAVKGSARIISPLGYARDMLRLHDDVQIESWRLDRIESGAASTYVVVEVDATALAVASRRRVPWPRWWSIEVRPGEKGWELVSVMSLERRLAALHALSPPETLREVIASHPEVDLDRFFIHLANTALDAGPAGCATALWLLRETEGEPAREALSYQVLSMLAAEKGSWDVGEMVTAAERSLVLAGIDGRPETLADAYYMVGWAYRQAGRFDDAVRAMRRSATYFEAHDDPRVPMLAMHSAVQIELERNHLRQALADAERHEEMLERFSTPRNRKESATQLAAIHERLGNMEISSRYNEEVRRIAHDMRDDGAEAKAIYNIALASARGTGTRRLLEEAWKVGREAMADRGATIQMALIDIQLDEGDFDAAESLLAEALSGAQRSKQATLLAAALVKRSVLRLLQGRAVEALEDARTARHLSGEVEVKAGNPLAGALAAEARALRALSRFDEAAAAWRAAIEVVELDLAERSLDEIGSGAVLRTQLAPYRELLELLAEQGCAREALAVAEQLRARSLRHALRHGHLDPREGIGEQDRIREAELEGALADINRRLLAARDAEMIERLRRERDEARLALRRFGSELHAMNPIAHRRTPGQQPIRITAEPGETVLEFAVNDDALFLFVLRGGDVAVRRVNISRHLLEAKVAAFVTALEQRDLAWRIEARALHDLLLGPVASELASARAIRILPDGALWRVPFHALIDRDGRHLVDRAVVSYSPSLALTKRCDTIPAARGTLLAFGDPAINTATADASRSLYRDVSLGRLPDAATEAQRIAKLYDGANVRTGKEAREAVFKEEAASYRILHLAAHSIVDDRAPMFSSIVLAASDANPLEDGLLEAREVADLKLGADLAVLSACETARGAVTPGEGILGLSWAFLAAGVPTTVVSQWKVGSASTAGLMIDFHRGLQGGAPPAEALRAAMLALRRDPRWQHPFYWAPFVVIENSGTPSERH